MTAPPKIRELLCFTNISSILEYTCEFRDALANIIFKMTELIQNHAAQFDSINNFTF